MKKKDKKKKKHGNGDQVDFSKHLRGLNRHLEKAKEKASEGGFEEYTDGKYRMRCVDAKIGVSKNKRVQVVMTWKFMDGDYKGKEKLDFEGLTEDHLSYLLRKLDAMGYDTSELESLEEDLKAILDDIKKSKPKCKVTLKTKGEFQNLYVDRLLEDDEEEPEEEDEEEDEDDEDSDDDSDDEDEDDEDEKPSKKSKKKKSKKDDDDDEDSDDEDDEESDDDEEEEDEEDEDSDDEDEDEDSDDDEEEEKPKKKKGKKSKDDDEDEEDEDEEDDEEEEVEDEVDITVGSVVTADSKKMGKVRGTVVELFEKENKVLLKTDKGKTLRIKADQIVSVEESPEESVPKKKKKKSKK